MLVFLKRTKSLNSALSFTENYIFLSTTISYLFSIADSVLSSIHLITFLLWRFVPV